jgi:acetoacetyl-CoA synthetase
VELTAEGGAVFFGRSDTTLNPGGVRIGTAEIYRLVEPFPEVLEALVIGQDYEGDMRIVLFVKLREGTDLTPQLIDQMKQTIRKNATPRHVPAVILACPDLPKTRSGKISEIAVRDIVHGRSVKNKEALLNPESLNFFKNLSGLT